MIYSLYIESRIQVYSFGAACITQNMYNTLQNI